MNRPFAVVRWRRIKCYRYVVLFIINTVYMCTGTVCVVFIGVDVKQSTSITAR